MALLRCSQRCGTTNAARILLGTDGGRQLIPSSAKAEVLRIGQEIAEGLAVALSSSGWTIHSDIAGPYLREVMWLLVNPCQVKSTPGRIRTCDLRFRKPNRAISTQVYERLKPCSIKALDARAVSTFIHQNPRFSRPLANV